ncbi:MAG: hypothetical protein IJ756_09165 [Paludibacteraceae bacterium]|nr:hypothetical protein [Paludibacteraceae bacterium]
MSKQLQIRNSTAEFLIFQAEDKAQGVKVLYQTRLFEKYRVIQDRLFESDFNKFTLPAKPFYERKDNQ